MFSSLFAPESGDQKPELEFSNYYRIGKFVENEFQEIGVRSNFFRYHIFFASAENRTDMKMQRIEMQKKICFFVGFEGQKNKREKKSWENLILRGPPSSGGDLRKERGR